MIHTKLEWMGYPVWWRKVKVKVISICIAPRREYLASKALKCWSHSFTCQHTTPAFIRSSPGGATTEWTVTTPADEAYYSLIDHVRMKGWVGLVGWATADVWPTKWSSIQLAVRRRTGKVRRSKTSLLPLCYAAKHYNMFSRFDTIPACIVRTDGRPAYNYYVLQHSWRT